MASPALIEVFRALGVDRVLTSDAERCRATVTPYAEAAGVDLEVHGEISERGYEADPTKMLGLASSAWSSGHVTAVCSHRPVLPALARELGLRVGKFSPGAFLVAHRVGHARVWELWAAHVAAASPHMANATASANGSPSMHMAQPSPAQGQARPPSRSQTPQQPPMQRLGSSGGVPSGGMQSGGVQSPGVVPQGSPRPQQQQQQQQQAGVAR